MEKSLPNKKAYVSNYAGGIWFSYKALCDAHPELKERRGVPFLAVSANGKPTAFGYVATPLELYNVVMGTYLEFEHAQIYETLHEEAPQKFRVDIDIAPMSMSHDECERIKNTIVEGVLELAVDLGLTVTPVVDECQTYRETKYSVHLISANWHVENVTAARSFYYLLLDKLKASLREDELKYLDPAVYRDGVSQFRVLYATKFREKQQKIYVATHTIGSTYTIPLPDIELFTRTLLMKVSSDSTLLKVTEVEKRQAAPKPKIERERNWQDADIPDTVLKEAFLLFQERAKDCSSAFVAGDAYPPNYLRLVRKKPSLCPFAKRTHEHDNCYLSVSGLEKDVYFGCYRCPGQRIHIGKLNAEIPDEYLFLEPHYDEIYESATIHPYIKYFKRTNTLCLSSGMGTGKTQGTLQLILDLSRELGRPIKFLILSPRQTFTFAIVGEYNRFLSPILRDEFKNPSIEVKNYMDYEPRMLRDCRCLVIQMESLFKLHSEEGFPKYDLIIIDESEANLAQFHSRETMTRLKQCSKAFWEVIRSADKVLVMDAFLSQRSVNVITAVRGQQPYVVHNTYQMDHRIAYNVLKKEELVRLMLLRLKEGKNIYLTSGSSKFQDTVEKVLEGLNLPHYCYSKFTSREAKEALSDVNKYWPPQRYFLATPALNVGVSCTEDVIDDLFCYATSSGSCTVRETFQSTKRMRNVRSGTLHYAISCRKSANFSLFPIGRLSADTGEMERLLKDMAGRMKLYLQEYEWNDDFQRNYSLGMSVEEAPYWLLLNYAYHLQEIYVNSVCYDRVFNRFLQMCGYVKKYYVYDKENKERSIVKDALSKNEETPLSYHEIPRMEDIDVVDLRGSLNYTGNLSGNKKEDGLMLLTVKRQGGLLTKKEAAILERYYFDKLVEPHLRKGADPSPLFDSCWYKKKDVLKMIISMKNGANVVAKELRAIPYLEMASRDIIWLRHFDKIISLLGGRQKEFLFSLPIIISLEAFEKIEGYISANEQELRNIFELENKKDTTTRWLLRSIVKKMGCGLKVKKSGKKKVIVGYTITAFPGIECLRFN